MTAARILDGKALAAKIRESVREKVARFRESTGIVPRLEVILAGEDSASQVYVRNKAKACQDAGMASGVRGLPDHASQAQILSIVEEFNADPAVHGILVQLPLPKGVDAQAVLAKIDPLKDVDGFHPDNAGLLAIGTPRFVPCTPLGIQRLLESEGIATQGQRAVILGRSNIVGKPMAQLLMSKGRGGDATVTVCHTATPDPAAIAREADILIAAMGQPEAVRADWIKPGAAVIDVGIHRRPNGSLCGDVAFAEVAEVASRITPVPGGVGPLTVAMLLENTLLAAQLQHSSSSSSSSKSK